MDSPLATAEAGIAWPQEPGRRDGTRHDGPVACGDASGVQVVDAKGQCLGTIRTPAVARNVAVGGADRRTLMTALESLYKVQMLSQGPSGRSK